MSLAFWKNQSFTAYISLVVGICLANILLLLILLQYPHLLMPLYANEGGRGNHTKKGASNSLGKARDSGQRQQGSDSLSEGGLPITTEGRYLIAAAGLSPIFGAGLLSLVMGSPQAPLLPQGPEILPGLRVVDGQRYPKTDAGVQAAIKDVGQRGTVLLLPGVYTISNAIVVNGEGVTIQGYGMGTRLLVNNPTADVFVVSGALFMLRDLEVDATVRKTGGAVVNVKATQGQISNLRLVGNFYNGFDFIGKSAGGWTINDIRVPGGVTWNRLFFLQSASGTVASTQIHNLICSNKIIWKDACVVLDTGVDTFLITDSEFGGPVVGIHCRNSLHGQAPRWVEVRSSYMEGGFTGTLLRLDAVRDFRYQGYLASGAVGVEIGSEAKNVDISHTIFVNFGREAIKLHRGAVATSISYNTFEDICVESSSDCDAVSVDAGASAFRIESNDFRSVQHGQPRYDINVLEGPSSRYSIVNNLFTDFTTDGLADRGTGPAKVISGNRK